MCSWAGSGGATEGSQPPSVVELAAAAVAAAAALPSQDWVSRPSMTGGVGASTIGMSVDASAANDWSHMVTAVLD